MGKELLCKIIVFAIGGGKGVTNIKITDKNGPVKAVMMVEGSEEIMLVSKNGIGIRIKCSDISVIGRATQGVRVMRMSEGDSVAASAKIVVEDDEVEMVEQPVSNVVADEVPKPVEPSGEKLDLEIESAKEEMFGPDSGEGDIYDVSEEVLEFEEAWEEALKFNQSLK